MNSFKNLLKLSNKKLIEILNLENEEQKQLWNTASTIRNNAIGNKVYLRGLIEFSNICCKNCLYCGIRKDMKNINRYRLAEDDVLECVDFIYKNNIKSIALQSGENHSNDFKKFLLLILKTIKNKYKDIVITVSCGEYDSNFYKQMFQNGAERYLIRIETSNKKLYSKLHPSDHKWEIRNKCLNDLYNLNYQVGTGNIIGVPHQTDNDLIEDLRYFVNGNFDMFGLGCYIMHEKTPLGTKNNIKKWNSEKNLILNKTLNFISMLRICLPNVNIAATTALDVISPFGRINALKAGANVMMPSITPIQNKQNYLLYQNKPNVDDTRETIIKQMNDKIQKANMMPAYGEAGNSLHFIKRKNKT